MDEGWVPHGSCFGPILFILMINEMPALVSKNCDHEEATNNPLYLIGEKCKKCGTVAGYGDNSNYNVAGHKKDNLQPRVSNLIKDNRVLCDGSGLKLNEGKTLLLRVTTRQQKQVNPNENIILEDLDENGENVRPKAYQRILGITFSQGLNWEAHLKTVHKAILPSVRKKIGALWIDSKFLLKESRLKLAN